MFIYKKFLMASVAVLFALGFVSANAQDNGSSRYASETLSTTDDELELLATVEILLDSERRPETLVYTLTNTGERRVVMSGRLSKEDFAKFISITQGEIQWRTRTITPIVTPRMAPGEVESPPDSRVLAVGESLSWRYDVSELIEDYAFFSGYKDLRRLTVVADIHYQVALEGAGVRDAKLTILRLRWRRGSS